ncbi:biotin--[acetyl-CoA-carboxylase] ligase [uncultured Maribacter sp.]|uniref:biotin--[acetyl-CoA-carboxylase] ligase n=1 Tax=uncultured Maribacter sp. TaxID=431308 RepID=UPI00260FD51D|nr:biotin--[acetyl-CoA-carboxylase] ligase [uncultured Maribacter sp.]
MELIKLSATDSTNAYLKDLMLSNSLKDFTTVVTDNQLSGRGQMGTVWDSEGGKNLTFSVLKKFNNFLILDQFLLSICISLSIYSTLSKLHVPNLSVKWPNDILSGNSKICGILLENSLSGNKIQTSVIGIGLNVNQIVFNNLLNVSSLKLLLGKTFNLDELLKILLTNLQVDLNNMTNVAKEKLFSDYEKVLFRKDKPSTFEDSNGNLFMGFIKGVSKQGKLLVMLEDKFIKEFGLKEIKLLY